MKILHNFGGMAIVVGLRIHEFCQCIDVFVLKLAVKKNSFRMSFVSFIHLMDEQTALHEYAIKRAGDALIANVNLRAIYCYMKAMLRTRRHTPKTIDNKINNSHINETHVSIADSSLRC